MRAVDGSHGACLPLRGAGLPPRVLAFTLRGLGRAILLLLIGSCALALAACGPSRLCREQILAEPRMAAVMDAYERVVADANASTSPRWHAGLTGNLSTNLFPTGNLGLCYHWQSIVFDTVAPVARSRGLQVTGIAHDRSTFAEHHAVVVFDPARISRDELLPPRTVPTRGVAFVLDAWRTGTPAVYDLDHWLGFAMGLSPPQLEDLDQTRPGPDGPVRPAERASMIPRARVK
ncbi:MAG: hypothetical protein ACK5WB_02145 [Phycisphaerales bacterium]|nr:hypothetical protein [Phycisphaeraceae bacterium]